MLADADFESLRQLPLVEKLRVLEALWDDIAASKEEFPLPPWIRGEVEQRLAECMRDPNAVITREELWRSVEEKRG
jgi:putative addiction module component (TIGR02574 family)